MKQILKEPPSAGAAVSVAKKEPTKTTASSSSSTNKMADMTTKFMSWTLNVIKETNGATGGAAPPAGENLYGVGVELALAQPRERRPSSTNVAATSSLPSDRPPRSDGERKHKHQVVIIIKSLHPSGPAARMGLQKGDVVLQVDSTELHYNQRAYSPADVAELVRGPEGTFVNMIIERKENGEILQKEYRLRREPIIGVRGRRMLKSNSEAVVAIREHHDSAPKAEAAEKSPSKAKVVPTQHMLDRLDSVLNEEKVEDEKKQFKALGEKEEDDDEMREQQSPLINQSPFSSSEEMMSEEKTPDNDVSSIADNNSERWELISDRSASTIVISISNGSLLSGSASHLLRCASPSLLKNKFVMEEYTGDTPYLEHIVLPTDTLQGLCLAYKVSATQLRMENKFSGNSLQMAPKKIKIPVVGVTNGMMIKTQDTTSKEFKLYAFQAEIPTMELVEAKAYLDLSNWDLEEAVRAAREDIDCGWDSYDSCNHAESPAVPMFASSIFARPKDLTVTDIHDAPVFEGEGFELKDVGERICHQS